MNLSEMFLTELELEATITTRFFDSLPTDQFDWQPHPKSMTLGRLFNHIVELPGWIPFMLATTELDFEKNPYTANDETQKNTLLDMFNGLVTEAKASLTNAAEEDFHVMWTLRTGADIYSVSPRWDVIRHTFNQWTHHRAQLGVYYRLLNLPVPSSYGGSADDQQF